MLFRRRSAVPTPALSANAVDVVPAGTPEALWAHHVAAARGPLPGATLTYRCPLPTGGADHAEAGQAFTVTFAAGQNVLHARRQVAVIAQLLRREEWTVLFVDDPAAAAERRAQLLLLDADFLEAPVPFNNPGFHDPQLQAGVMSVGLQADGSTAPWTLWNQHGARHGTVIGGPGSGLTNLLGTVLTTAALSDRVDPWLIDLEPYGPALPAWGAHNLTRIARALPEAVDLLRRADQVAQARAADPWPWSADTASLLMIVIAGAEQLAKDRTGADLLERLLRHGRKVGVSVQLGVPTARLDAFGDRPTLRAAACSGNVAVLGNTDPSTAATLINDLPGNPSHLPRSTHDGREFRGLGYLAGQRTRFRAYHLTNPGNWATAAYPVPVAEDVLNPPTAAVTAAT